MTLNRLMLFVLTALVGAAAIYFWMIQLVAVTAALLLAFVVIGGLIFALRHRRKH